MRKRGKIPAPGFALLLLLFFQPPFLPAQAPPGRTRTGETGARFPLAYTPRWQSLGPANMSGRITGIAVNPKRPATWYVATASGGLFKTTDAGTTWTPVFDRATTVSLGAVALAPSDPKVVWVGTGEANARNSVSWGDGVYVSRDGGRTWTHAGLAKTFQIGRIAVDPKDPDTVYAAACGKLWGTNPERGVFRTRDGGKTWKKVLWVDEKTGAVDVLIDPENSKRILAATWDRRRDGFDTNDPPRRFGKGAGIWRSDDGGDHWKRLQKGLPTVRMGRIGLTLHPGKKPVLYALIATERLGWPDGETPPGTGRGENKKKGFGAYLGGQVENVQDKQGPRGFQTGGVYRSGDWGETWRRVNSLNPRPYYFGRIRVDPSDPERVYVLGAVYFVSRDGGKTFKRAKGSLHADFHDIWIDPSDPEHLLMGCDGGVFESRNRGKTWRFFDNLPCAQYYHVDVDDREPYYIYGGLQDNGTWGFPSRTRLGDGIVWGDVFNLGWGDGFVAHPHPKDPDLLFFESQFGGIGWRNLRTGRGGWVKKPKPPAGKKLLFNWDTPFQLDPFNPDILWMAGNYVIHVSGGWKKAGIMSPPLGKTGRGTATVLVHSSKSRGLLYAGTDDGALWISRDSGRKWKSLDQNVHGLPGPLYVSGIEPSRFSSGRVYLSFDGHRSDDLGVYIFSSENFGRRWKRIGAGIGRGPVHEVREDPFNADLLYAGTEFGIFASLDRGKSWFSLKGNLPTVAVRDMVVQKEEKDLVIATHGRGVWRLDVSGLEACARRMTRREAVLFKPKVVTLWVNQMVRMRQGDQVYRVPNPPPAASIYYWFKERPKESPHLQILKGKDKVLRALKATALPGLNRVEWDLREEGKKGKKGKKRPGPLVKPGSYTIRLTLGKAAFHQVLQVRPDPMVKKNRKKRGP